MIQITVTYWRESFFDQKDRGLALRKMGEEARNRYYWAAQTIEVLDRDGWVMRHYRNATYAQHKDVLTENAARERLVQIGIDPESVSFSSTWQDFTEG